MVSGKHKSRSMRKVFVRTPGSRTTVHYKSRKPSKAVCVCGAPLKGVPNLIPSKMGKLSKSQKKPERPYGGNLCSRCMRIVLKEKTREI